jgi:anti-sigma factor RsiW
MTINHALTCRKVVKLVIEYLENVLLPETRMQLEEHIAHCPGCPAYLEQVRQMIGMLYQFAQEPAFPATKRNCFSSFRTGSMGLRHGWIYSLSGSSASSDTAVVES